MGARFLRERKGPSVALRLHDLSHVPELKVSNMERRYASGGDRRRRSRSGRRASDPRVNWRRLAWLFAAYAVYVSVRSLPATVRKIFQRTPAA